MCVGKNVCTIVCLDSWFWVVGWIIYVSRHIKVDEIEVVVYDFYITNRYERQIEREEKGGGQDKFKKQIIQ